MFRSVLDRWCAIKEQKIPVAEQKTVNHYAAIGLLCPFAGLILSVRKQAENALYAAAAEYGALAGLALHILVYTIVFLSSLGRFFAL